ncbi:MAG TPA: Nif3-like dinuclear metal center hexameric protein [Spirochaetota bacterium]|nr:Nif3-like dinuclear metal center hexameric protein [Spirochaetota bacterium]
MKVSKLIEELNRIYPESFQENYDNTGQQVIFPERDITGVYVSLDVEKAVIDDAGANNCNMIVTHHPLIFRPVKKIVSGEARSSMLISLVKGEVSLYAMHTNFDKFMFRYLADELGFPGSRLLFKTEGAGEAETGFGSMAVPDKAILLGDLLSRVRDALGLDYLLYSGEESMEIRSIAFINGSGGGSVERTIQAAHPDCIITGDAGYHHARYAIDSGTALVDAGHFGTEIIFKKMLAQTITGIMNANGEKSRVIISGTEKNPFKLYR